MGTDIHGWIEIQSAGAWWAIANAGSLLPRSYGMFGLLFGIHESHGFEPIVPIRGIPDDASDRVVSEYLEFDYNHDPTWISHSEVSGIDWDEEVQSIQIHHHGTWKFHSHKRSREETEWESEGYGKPYEEDGVRYRVVKARRRTFQTPEWMLTFKWMDDLAELYGADNVRFVVWFDS